MENDRLLPIWFACLGISSNAFELHFQMCQGSWAYKTTTKVAAESWRQIHLTPSRKIILRPRYRMAKSWQLVAKGAIGADNRLVWGICPGAPGPTGRGCPLPEQPAGSSKPVYQGRCCAPTWNRVSGQGNSPCGSTPGFIRDREHKVLWSEYSGLQ